MKYVLNLHLFLVALQTYRKREGYGLRQVAQETGISPSKLSRIEHGKLYLLADFITLCAWMGLDPRTFIEPKGS